MAQKIDSDKLFRKRCFSEMGTASLNTNAPLSGGATR